MTTTPTKIGIVCCSDGYKKKYSVEIDQLQETLHSIGLQPVLSDCIYAKEDVFSGTGKERAEALMKFYEDEEISGIFDISGGDIANGILPYLDYRVIADSGKTFWGYSDLTTVLNAIYAKTGRPSILYQIRNLLYDHGAQQIHDFKKTFIDHTDDLFRIRCRALAASAESASLADQPTAMRGVVVGGNIRCFLKLAGTEFMPDLTDKILLLESLGGTAARMETCLCQLEQIGAFRKVAGILLGTFTEMQQKKSVPTMETLIQKFVGTDMPVAVTNQIGHGTDSKAIRIGQKLDIAILHNHRKSS